MTIYRVAGKSAVIKHLCAAAENGKAVTVLVELRARFDEGNNITWARELEEAGCRVIYGPAGYKCHGKICLITLKGEDGAQLCDSDRHGQLQRKDRPSVYRSVPDDR